jgi:disulfide oxidoreductase YuzD
VSILAEELHRRFGDRAKINYYDVRAADAASVHAQAIADIKARGLIYPVTVIDGEPVADRSISYPLIMRTVQSRLSAVEG